MAQQYPIRPLRLIVPNGAGGSTDLVARTIANKLADALHQQVVVDNRGGSGGIIGTEIVGKSAPDGYTLLVGTIGNLAISPHLYRKLPYDPLRDFAPVTQLSAAAYMLLVNPALPARSVRDFVNYAKNRGGQLSYASAGNGTGSHLSTVLFISVAGLDIAHVPYKGGAPGITDLIANQVQMMFNGIPSSLPHIASGRIRALAVSSPNRVAVAPELPTFAEAGYAGAEATSWTGVLAPAATPPAVINRLNTELRAILQSPDIRSRMQADGAEPAGSTPSAFGAYIRSELAKWGTVVRATGARAD
jgi:tripartite-type tricarboxylate transporter receptor subunit TctC